MIVYFCYHIIDLKIILKNKVVKFNRVHDLGSKFGGLSRKAQVDLIYNCLNIKNKILS
jgi:hypothetical protein